MSKNRDQREYWEEEGEDEFFEEAEEELEEFEEEPPRRRKRRRPQRRRSIWPWLLLGCAGGVLVVVLAAGITVLLAIKGAVGSVPLPGLSGQNFTKVTTQPLSISALDSLQIHNQVGNVTVTVDSSASAVASVTITKRVVANNQDDANREFNSIAPVQIDPVDSALTITATVPDAGGTTLGNPNPKLAVDLTVTLTAALTTSTVNVNIDASVGDVLVQGVSGQLTIKNHVGNVSVQQALLSKGSYLGTGNGNVTFNGLLQTTCVNSSAVPCFKMLSETGNVDVTLPSVTQNILLDAHVNVGTITSDFAINIVKKDTGEAEYQGSLFISTTQPTAKLVLDVSTGNIALHKATL